MSLYNDGFSNRALCLAMGLSFGAIAFVQTGANNLLANDTFEIGNSTFTIVAAIGATPGNVLKGANWLATMNNIAASLQASIAGTPATANYIPLATPANVDAVVGAGIATFNSIAPGAGVPSVYTASGTAGGSFPAASFGVASAQTRAFDWTIALGLSLQFEIAAPIVNPAIFQVWSDIPSAGNPGVASGISGNQVEVTDEDLCYPITGAADPMVVTIPATAIVSGVNTQGFLQTVNVSAVGGIYQGRPRCIGAGKFLFVKAISGDVANVNISALLSRLKITS